MLHLSKDMKDVTSLKIANRLRPALRLCPDVLEYTFLLGASVIANPFLRRSMVLSYSQTCHDWRSVALSSKFLWLRLVDFDFLTWRWNQEMLQRSDPLPIVIGSHCCLPRKVESVEAELEHCMERIRAYHLGFTRDTWGILVEKLQRPAEQMISLNLAHLPQRHGSHPSNTWYDDQSASFVLPYTLFSLSAPDLRHLSLRGCFLDIRSPIYVQLTSLHVMHIDTRYNTALTSLEWLHLLSRMPQLRSLQLKNAIYPPESFLTPKRVAALSQSMSSTPLSPVLPNLEDLHLFGPFTEVAAVLGGIDISPGCRISVTCLDCRTDDNELDGILKSSFRGLAHFIKCNESSSFQTSPLERSKFENCMLSATFYGSGSTLCMRVVLNLLGPTNEGSFSSPEILSSSWIPSVFLCLDTPDACWQSILSPLLDTLSDRSFLGNLYDPITSNISSLELLLPSPHPNLIPFLARTSNVKELNNLTGYFGAWLLQEMGSWALRSRGRDSGVILPRLEELSFSDDQCLYGDRWNSLEMFLKSRVPVHDRSAVETFSACPSRSTRRMQDDVSRIKRVLFPYPFLPEDKVSAITSLGVSVWTEVTSA